MLEKLAPEFRFASLTDIETEWLKEHQFEALVLDIDNTLLARDCTRIPADHLFWLQNLRRAGIDLVLVSNNGGPRVEELQVQLKEHDVPLPILTWAGKPLKPAFLRACALLNHSPSSMGGPAPGILVVGDQLFTDVLGARRSGILALMVEPKGGARGPWQKVLHALQEPFKRASAHDERTARQ